MYSTLYSMDLTIFEGQLLLTWFERIFNLKSGRLREQFAIGNSVAKAKLRVFLDNQHCCFGRNKFCDGIW